MAEIQTGLQQYLNEKNLNVLFVEIVENLLLAKPENPIGFMVTHLLEKYPQETKDHIPKPTPAP